MLNLKVGFFGDTADELAGIFKDGIREGSFGASKK